jgi:hypothetical protein
VGKGGSRSTIFAFEERPVLGPRSRLSGRVKTMGFFKEDMGKQSIIYIIYIYIMCMVLDIYICMCSFKGEIGKKTLVIDGYGYGLCTISSL